MNRLLKYLMSKVKNLFHADLRGADGENSEDKIRWLKVRIKYIKDRMSARPDAPFTDWNPGVPINEEGLNTLKTELADLQ